jgi:hypothetical protein
VRDKRFAARSAHRRFGKGRSDRTVEKRQYDQAIAYLAKLKERFNVFELQYGELGCPKMRKKIEEFVGFRGVWPEFVNQNSANRKNLVGKKKVTTFRYCLTNRGLFSELNNLINGYYFALREGSSFTVDDSESRLYFSEGFESYFRSIDTTPRVASGIIDVVRGHSPDQLKRRRAFGETERRFRQVRHRAKQELTFEQKKVLARVLAYTDSTAAEINSTLDALRLPKNYSCMHVRWGDKVGDRPHGTRRPDAKKRQLADYFEALPENLSDLFIMSDDYAAVECALRHIKTNDLPIQVHTLCTPRQNGHSTKLRVNNGNNLTREELITLFAECEIAKNADHFVGTMSSNVGRYIKLIHKNPENCISLDLDWHPC